MAFEDGGHGVEVDSPFMVDSPRTQISPGVFAGKDNPVLGSLNLSSSPERRKPTEPGLDGPLPWAESQCDIVTQLYSVNPYACWTSMPGNLVSKALWSSMPSGAAAVKTVFNLSLLRSKSSPSSVFTSCRSIGGTIGANVTPCFSSIARKSFKLYLKCKCKGV